MEVNKRLSKKTLLAYGCGDLASNLCWTFIGSYLTVYYTDVVGLTPAITSMIMLIARVWDAVDDPVFGAIAERTNTKMGRFRPYIFYGTPFLALFSVLVFTTIGSGKVAIFWAGLTYIVCGILYSTVNLCYGSLSTVMTNDPEDISQLTSWRMMGTNFGAVLINAIATPLLLAFSGGTGKYTSMGYTKVAILFAVCAVPLFYFLYANCKETIIPPVSATKVSIKTSVKSVLTNKPLMVLFVIQLIAMTAFFGRMGVVIYYLIYNVKRFDLIPWFMSLPSIFTILGIFITKNYVVKFGKKKMCSIGYIGAGLSLVALFFVGYTNIPVLLALHCLYGFFCFSFPIPMSMIPDAINYQQDKTGIRSDGTSYATVSLSTKFGGAIGVSVALLVMGATGYVANTQQSAAALNGINLTVNLLFGIMFLLCLIPLKLYPLNEKKNEAIRERLEKKVLEIIK